MTDNTGHGLEKVLVTGGAGYIGSHVILALAGAGYFPLVVDNLSTGKSRSVLVGKLITENIANSGTIATIIRKHAIKSVLHFAAHIEVEESVRNPIKYYENNSISALSLIKTCLENGVENFVFSSTAAVYGIPQKLPVSESAILQPINPYGASKKVTEMILRDVSFAYPEFRYAALRYFNVAGADRNCRIGQDYPKPTHLITMALRTALGDYPDMKVFGTDYDTPDGTTVRDYIHVDDLAEAHLLALGFLKNEKKSRIFNCGYNRGLSVLDVIGSVKKVTGIDFPVQATGRRPGDPPSLIADASRIRSELGWKPKYQSLDEIITTAWNWEKKLRQTQLH